MLNSREKASSVLNGWKLCFNVRCSQSDNCVLWERTVARLGGGVSRGAEDGVFDLRVG